MKNLNPMLIALSLTIAACSPSGSQQSDVSLQPEVGPAAAQTTAEQEAGTTQAVPGVEAAAAVTGIDTLSGWHWRLKQATNAQGQPIEALLARTDQPLELNFRAGRLSITNTCNPMNAEVRISQSSVQMGVLASTLMACADPEMTALDAAVKEQLQGNMDYQLDRTGEQPKLTLTSEAGTSLVFDGVPTAETRFGGPGETIFLEVAAEKTPCGDDDTHSCLNVRQLHYADNGVRSEETGPWHALQQPIEGYQHEAGIRNVLRVKRFNLNNASETDHAYVLDMVVESESRAN